MWKAQCGKRQNDPEPNDESADESEDGQDIAENQEENDVPTIEVKSEDSAKE